MNDDMYSVLCDGKTIAKQMQLEDALLLIQALMEKYFNEQNFSCTILREEAVLND